MSVNLDSKLPTSSTRVLAIIGDPIEHSITPRIQNAAWQHAAPGSVVNVAFRVAAENLESAVRGAQTLGLLGLMVTIPHKERVLTLCDELDTSARLMGAANLLHFHDGKIIGHSSDGWAAIESLREEGVEVTGKSICILGGGGASRSLALSFARAGANEIVLLNRTPARVEQIAIEVRALNIKCRALPLEPSTLRATLPDCDLLVNATSVGMHPHESQSPLPVELLDELLTPRLAVYDIVYNPLETQLLKAARQRGARCVDGLGMLIYTNVYAAQICAGSTLSAKEMREEALRALATR